MKGFIAYSHADRELVGHLDTHLQAAGHAFWRDPRINAGEVWDKMITDALAEAEVFVLCVSATFLTSRYIQATEMARALERHAQGTGLVVPVIVRPCQWTRRNELSVLQAVPQGGLAITQWPDCDAACDDAVSKICDAMDAFARRRMSATVVRTAPASYICAAVRRRGGGFDSGT